MSSFAPSISPLHPTEGIGQGVISDIIPQRQSSRTTSIHILDDDSLLNIFYLYRPDVTMIDESENFDDVRISIIGGRRWDRQHWWCKPAQVCRRWRNLILESASFLGLHLVCTLGTPVADMLAHSPPLPLVIDYFGGDRNLTAEDEEEIFLALEQPNRVRCIRVGMSLRGLQKLLMAIDDELPILECLVMTSGREDDASTLVFPDKIEAPHLRHLVLVGVAPPIGSRLLTTAVGLVTLCLLMGDSSTYLNPNSLLQWISSLPQLETLVIITFSNRDVEMQLSHMPTITHVTLPNLRLLSFEGVSSYLEVLIRQIATPRLERLHIMFFKKHTFSIPSLVRFMNATENKRLRFDSAKLAFSDKRVRVETYPHEEKRWSSFSISVDSWNLNGRISSMARIIDALGQVFSAVDHLILDYEEDGRSSEYDFEVEVDRTEWHKLLRPFSNVKNLRVNHGLVQEFSRYLRLDDGKLPPELLPELQELTYFRSSDAGDAFTSFIDARRNAGHPVSLVRGSPCPSP
ncbi:hypothetical protein F5888DRAFT_1803948 [Russula emetica]|nr:hypothetical protein F5888DRAFT_1803948 [Russula emetica]